MNAKLLLIGGLLFLVGCLNGTGADAPGDDGGNEPPPPPPPPPATLEWAAVPALDLTVGVAVDVDLRDYLTEPNGAAAITLDAALPAGVALTNGVIAGTPTVAMASRSYRATATDSVSSEVSASFLVQVNDVSAELLVERRTPEQIGLYLPLTNTPANATATVRYRPASETTWRTAHPLLRIRPEWNTGGAPVTPVDAFAGTIFDLTPGASYEVEVAIEGAGAPQTLRSVVSTRALPGAAGAATVDATTSDDLQAKFDELQPGDVLQLANGTYNVSGLHLDVSGTANAPITIRGQSRDGVVLENSGTILQIQRASHIVLEDLTFEGSSSDSGTSASSRAISFWSGALQEYVTCRRLTMRGIDMGIVAWGTVNSVLVYQCKLTGNNAWTSGFIETNLTWNDDGIRLPGEGNCAFENTLHGFGDSFAVASGVFSAAVYFYRNKITMTGDDACEGDYGTRNIGFYDNHVTNCAILLSLDPLWGGPLYCFRNVAINTIRGPFKLNNTQSGFLIYNNTIVRSNGTKDWGSIQNNDGTLRNWTYRNNILVYHGTGQLLALDATGMTPIDFTHNGWYPDREVRWKETGGTFANLAAALAGLPATTALFGTSTRRHDQDVILVSEPFLTAVPVGANFLTEVTTHFVPALKASAAARSAGTAIPGITDGHSGGAPDMGAIITGRPATSWGAE